MDNRNDFGDKVVDDFLQEHQRSKEQQMTGEGLLSDPHHIETSNELKTLAQEAVEDDENKSEMESLLSRNNEVSPHSTKQLLAVSPGQQKVSTPIKPLIRSRKKHGNGSKSTTE